MCIHTSQLRCLIIHHLHKAIHRACHMLRYTHSYIIGRLQHKPVQSILHSHFFTGLNAQMAASEFNIKYDLRISDFFIQTAVFQGYKCSHDLGNTGRILLSLRVLTIQECPCGGVHHCGGLRLYLLPLRPSFNFIRFYRKVIRFGDILCLFFRTLFPAVLSICLSVTVMYRLTILGRSHYISSRHTRQKHRDKNYQ